MTVDRIERVCGFDGRLLAGLSPVETENAAEIADVWARASADNPKLFNGRVMLADSVEAVDGRLKVAFRETSFAAFLWLQRRGPGERRLLNVFGGAAVVSCDGAALLGRMGRRTLNAGKVYFPAGTPDLDDVFGETVDVEASIGRELAEETGLAFPQVRPSARRVAVWDGRYVAYLRRYDSDLDAAALGLRARAFLAADPEPELEAIVFVRAGEPAPEGMMAYAAEALPLLLAP